MLIFMLGLFGATTLLVLNAAANGKPTLVPVPVRKK